MSLTFISLLVMMKNDVNAGLPHNPILRCKKSLSWFSADSSNTLFRAVWSCLFIAQVHLSISVCEGFCLTQQKCHNQNSKEHFFMYILAFTCRELSNFILR